MAPAAGTTNARSFKRLALAVAVLSLGMAPRLGRAEEPAALPAAESAADLSRCVSAADAGEIIYLGKPDYRQQATVGVNLLPERGSAGLIGLYRLKRTTKLTFYELWLEGYIVPGLRPDERTWTYGRARLKRSGRWLSALWLYDWSTYEAKSASDEGLSLRAILASGFGTFLFQREKPLSLLNLNLEVGFVVDYANLRAYADQVFNGYAKSALELDFRQGNWSGKAVSSLLYQVTTAAKSTYAPNQSRHEADLLLAYNVTRELRVTVGTAINHFFLRAPTDIGLPRLAYTVFLGATFRP